MTTLQIMENAKAATKSLMLCDETKKNEILEGGTIFYWLIKKIF